MAAFHRLVVPLAAGVVGVTGSFKEAGAIFMTMLPEHGSLAAACINFCTPAMDDTCPTVECAALSPLPPLSPYPPPAFHSTPPHHTAPAVCSVPSHSIRMCHPPSAVATLRLRLLALVLGRIWLETPSMRWTAARIRCPGTLQSYHT